MALTTLSVDSADMAMFIKQKIKQSSIEGKEISHAQYFHILVIREEKEG
jgi:hypothetical protein